MLFRSTGRNVSGCVCAGAGETVECVGTDFRIFCHRSCTLYDERLLAEHRLVGLPADGGAGTDFVCCGK